MGQIALFAQSLRPIESKGPSLDGARMIRWKMGRRKVTYEFRGRGALFGPMGGGWLGKLGVEWGPRTVMLNLVDRTVRISRG